MTATLEPDAMAAAVSPIVDSDPPSIEIGYDDPLCLVFTVTIWDMLCELPTDHIGEAVCEGVDLGLIFSFDHHASEVLRA